MFKLKLNMNFRMNFFVKTAIFTFIFFCIISIINLQFNLKELKNERISLEQRISDSNDIIEQLSDQLAQPYDDEYIKRIAKDKLNYRMPDEIIYYNDLLK